MSVHVFVQKISSKNLFLLVLASMLWSCRFSVTERKETKRRVKKNATLQRRGRTQACSQACSHPSSRQCPLGIKIIWAPLRPQPRAHSRLTNDDTRARRPRRLEPTPRASARSSIAACVPIAAPGRCILCRGRRCRLLSPVWFVLFSARQAHQRHGEPAAAARELRHRRGRAAGGSRLQCALPRGGRRRAAAGGPEVLPPRAPRALREGGADGGGVRPRRPTRRERPGPHAPGAGAAWHLCFVTLESELSGRPSRLLPT